jgi:DNA-binding PadR family transcriptional regulator
MEKNKEEQLLDGLIQELRRGTIVLAVLSQLKSPQYGYSLIVLMKEKGLSLEANTLYPLLRRLEKQGILESLWDTDGTKPRKYYKLSSLGETVYLKLCEAWKDINNVVNNMIEN